MLTETTPKKTSVQFFLAPFPTPSPPCKPVGSIDPATKQSKSLGQLDDFQHRYIKPIPKKIASWIMLKEPTREAWKKYRKEILAHYNIKKHQKGEKLATVVHANAGRVPTHRASKVEKQAEGGSVIQGVKKNTKDVVSLVKEKATSTIERVIPCSKKGTSKFTLSYEPFYAGNAPGAVRIPGTGMLVHPPRPGGYRSGGHSGWVAPSDW